MMEEKEGWDSWWWEYEATALHVVEDQKGGKRKWGGCRIPLQSSPPGIDFCQPSLTPQTVQNMNPQGSFQTQAVALPVGLRDF